MAPRTKRTSNLCLLAHIKYSRASLQFSPKLASERSCKPPQASVRACELEFVFTSRARPLEIIFGINWIKALAISFNVLYSYITDIFN